MRILIVSLIVLNSSMGNSQLSRTYQYYLFQKYTSGFTSSNIVEPYKYLYIIVPKSWTTFYQS